MSTIACPRMQRRLIEFRASLTDDTNYEGGPPHEEQALLVHELTQSAPRAWHHFRRDVFWLGFNPGLKRDDWAPVPDRGLLTRIGDYIVAPMGLDESPVVHYAVGVLYMCHSLENRIALEPGDWLLGRQLSQEFDERLEFLYEQL